jgi:hypothetical protein
MGCRNVGRAVATAIGAIVLLVACAPAGVPAQPPVNADARALASLQERLTVYLALHNKLEGTLPSLPKDASPEQIDQHQRAFAKLVQEARRGAKRGDIFTRESRRVILNLMKRVFGGPDGRELRTSIMDENPGLLLITINGRYPDTVPLSTVPPQVLAGLPSLPQELEFRFIERRLILMDVHAHIILDYIDNALPG